MRRHDHTARLAAIVESSNDAIMSRDLRGVVTSWNRGAETLFGYTAEEAVGRSMIDLVVPLDRVQEEREVAAKIRRGEAVARLETIRCTKGGRRVAISVSVSPIRDKAGEVIGSAEVARDITERHRADEARARLAAIVEWADDAIVSEDLDGIIQSWNPAAGKLFGYTAAEAIGRHISLVIPPEGQAEEDDVLARVRRGESVVHFETVRVTKDGRRLDISLTVSAVRNAAGEIVGASQIGRDITAQRRMEADRTALLAREQAAREEAEALNRGKDQFLAVLSHEMRTPLNAIYGWARMIHDARLDPAMRARGVDVILRNAKAQLQLVEDLLDVSRVVTGAMRLDLRTVDLETIVASVVDSIRPVATAKQLDLELSPPDGGATVLGAPERLQQVIWNLLMNAVKFTPSGGKIRVTVRRVDGHVELTVADTGEGIPAQVLPYVFDRFRQGDSTGTRAHGGLGIGLALVRHLVELHGGTVRAESGGAGHGATFTVTIPLARPGTVDGPLVQTAAPGVPSPLTLRDVRVLIVDDDVDGLELAGVVLANAGADVRTRTSAADARETLREWPADVLLLDIEMPGEDGYTLLRRIRDDEAARGEGHRTPAIALTAYGSAQDRTRAFAAGFNLHLAKPVDPNALTVAIASLAGRL